MLKSGELRHRVEIQARVDVQDPTTGTISHEWVTEHTNLPAKVAPLTVREFITAQAQQSGISGRITIRYLPGISAANYRVLHDGRFYYVTGVLPDPESGREYLTLVVSEGQESGT